MAIRPKNSFSLSALTRILGYYGEEVLWFQTPADLILDLEAVCRDWREYTRSDELDRDINGLQFRNEIICAPIPAAREMLLDNGAIFELETGGFLVMTDEHDEIVWLPPMVQIFEPAYTGYL